MDVKALQARLAAFAAERGWDGAQNPRNLAIAIAGEAGMLLDLFRWLTDAQSHRIESEYKREAAEEAIADLLLHTLRIADKLGVDVERAIAKKLAENDANYPLPLVEPAPAPQPVPVAEDAALPAEPKKAPPPEPVAAPPEAAPEPTTEKKAPAAPGPAPAQPAGKAAPPPAAEETRAPLLAPPQAAPTPEAPKPAAEPPKPPSDKALPSWLDGIMPARSAPARKKPATASRPDPEPPRVPAPPRTPEPRPPAAAPAVEAIEAAPPPSDEAQPVEHAPAEASWEPDRYAHLDTDAAKGFAKSLAKRVDGARSDDPLLRELHDEVETLRRTLYSPTPKRSWMGDSLKTIRAILEEANTHSVGEVLRARDYIAQIDRMLNP